MRNTVFLLFAAWAGHGYAQDKIWTLEQCVQHAIEHSLDVQQSELAVETAEIAYRQSTMSLFPDLNGSGGVYSQSGRTIDRFTNTYVRKGIQSSNFSLASSMFLYAGGQVRNRIKADKYGWMASEADLKSMEQNIALSTANLFLQIAQAKELVKSVSQNLENTKAQLDRAEKQFAAGAVNEGIVLNLRAQMANDEASIINAQNQEQTALVNLKMLLRIPYEESFDVALPESVGSDASAYPEDVNALYNSAVSRRPEILAADLRVQSSMFYRKYSKGALFPLVTAGLNLGTVYSSNALYIKDTIPGDIVAIGRVKGTNELVEAQRVSFDFATIKLGEQLQNNFGQSMGINVSVPIFSRLTERSNLQRADIQLEQSKLNLERTKQSLYNEVVAAYTAFESARSRLKAATLSSQAQSINLDFVQKRFDGGQGSATELQMAKSTEAMGRVNLVSARYEYIFRKLILDFYMGKNLEIR